MGRFTTGLVIVALLLPPTAHATTAVGPITYEVLERMRNGLAIDYRGWVPNAEVPRVYSASKVALHVPRRQYVTLLPGTPTIRVFEALASGVCLVSLPWPDPDGLFSVHYLVVP